MYSIQLAERVGVGSSTLAVLLNKLQIYKTKQLYYYEVKKYDKRLLNSLRFNLQFQDITVFFLYYYNKP